MQLENIIAKELAAIIKEQFAAHVEQIKTLETRLAIVEARKPEKGERGERGEKGDRGDSIAGKDGKDGRDGTDGRDGAIGPQGPRGEAGPPGEKGLDGKDGRDGAGPSRGRHRGPWKHDDKYNLDDSVTSGGSGWIALIDDPQGRPGTSKHWQLFVMKGRDGKDGERGPPGPPGPRGKNYDDA